MSVAVFQVRRCDWCGHYSERHLDRGGGAVDGNWEDRTLPWNILFSRGFVFVDLRCGTEPAFLRLRLKVPQERMGRVRLRARFERFLFIRGNAIDLLEL